MIVRILGEGQLDVPDSGREALDEFDAVLQQACAAGDADGFDAALGALLAKVRELGKPLPDDHVVHSELVLPSADASLAEVQELLTDEGLIPR